MVISNSIIESIEKSSWIRKMFEEGATLKKKYGAENVFDFSLGNPDVDPPKEFFDAMKDIASSQIKGIHGYMPNGGFPNVKNEIASLVTKDQDIEINGNSIIMTCGAAGGLNTIFKTILNRDDEVIVIRPYFVEYGFYITNHGGKIVLADPAEDFTLDIENIKKVMTNKTKAILINTPNNPTGAIYSQEQINDLAKLLNEKSNSGHSIYLISDEPYRDIIYDDITIPSILKSYDNSLVVTSFSKTLSIPGERIGYIAVNPKINDYSITIAGLTLSNRILGFVNAPAFMQRVVASLKSISVATDIYKKRRDIFVKGLKDAGYEFEVPRGAFYIFVKAPKGDDIKFVEYLKSLKILTVPGTGFGYSGYFRISYCVSETIIKNSLQLFEKAIQNF